MGERNIAEAFPPGEFLKDALESRGWSQIDLADIIGRSPAVVNEIIMGKRSITPETAKALAEAFGTSAQLWMNLESSYQLWKSNTKGTNNVISRKAKLYQLAPIKEMVKRHWIEPSESIDIFERRIMQFFEIKDLNEEINYRFVARKATADVTSSHVAWYFRAKQLAYGVYAAPFSNQSFQKGLYQLRTILPDPYSIRLIPKILSDAGIRFLILEHLPKTKIDGATFWLDKQSPVIALSLRYERIDSFWFTLVHELRHVERQDGRSHLRLVLDTDLIRDEKHKYANDEQEPEEELDANKFAREFLVDQQALDSFIIRHRPLYSKQDIINFSKLIKVHPSLVVGQLQFREEIMYSAFRSMLGRVRDIITQSTLTDGWGRIAPIFKDKEAYGNTN